jgi:hypothetical protein
VPSDYGLPFRGACRRPSRKRRVVTRRTRPLVHTGNASLARRRPSSSKRSSRIDPIPSRATAPASGSRRGIQRLAGQVLRQWHAGRNSALSASIQARGNPLLIGADIVPSQFYRGFLDEVRIYNRALTASEVQTDITTPVGSALNTSPLHSGPVRRSSSAEARCHRRGGSVGLFISQFPNAGMITAWTRP